MVKNLLVGTMLTTCEVSMCAVPCPCGDDAEFTVAAPLLGVGGKVWTIASMYVAEFGIWPFSLLIATSSTAIRSNVSRIIARLVMYHVFFETFDFECCPVLSYRLTDHRLHLRRPWYRSLDWNTTLIPRGNLACFSQSAFQQMQQSIVMLIAALTATDKITAENGAAAALILLGTIQVALAMPEQIMGVIKSMVLKAGDKVSSI